MNLLDNARNARGVDSLLNFETVSWTEERWGSESGGGVGPAVGKQWLHCQASP